VLPPPCGHGLPQGLLGPREPIREREVRGQASGWIVAGPRAAAGEDGKDIRARPNSNHIPDGTSEYVARRLFPPVPNLRVSPMGAVHNSLALGDIVRCRVCQFGCPTTSMCLDPEACPSARCPRWRPNCCQLGGTGSENIRFSINTETSAEKWLVSIQRLE
jgi:hypothetical protein